MRNLKRALSLALASVMLLGMMVVGSNAAIADVDYEKHNAEALEVLKLVGAMVGDGTNINPDQKVTRNEAAVVLSHLMGGAEGYVAHPFTDVPAWATPAVALCYAEGITAGISATEYGGNNTITTLQAGLYVLKALGYFQGTNDLAIDGWEKATTKAAAAINLFDGVSAKATEGLTRNDFAQIVFNALNAKAPKVEGPVLAVDAAGKMFSVYTYAPGEGNTTLAQDLGYELDRTFGFNEINGRPEITWTNGDDSTTFPMVAADKFTAAADWDEEDLEDYLKANKWDDEDDFVALFDEVTAGSEVEVYVFDVEEFADLEPQPQVAEELTGFDVVLFLNYEYTLVQIDSIEEVDADDVKDTDVEDAKKVITIGEVEFYDIYFEGYEAFEEEQWILACASFEVEGEDEEDYNHMIFAKPATLVSGKVDAVKGGDKYRIGGTYYEATIEVAKGDDKTWALDAAGKLAQVVDTTEEASSDDYAYIYAIAMDAGEAGKVGADGIVGDASDAVYTIYAVLTDGTKTSYTVAVDEVDGEDEEDERDAGNYIAGSAIELPEAEGVEYIDAVVSYEINKDGEFEVVEEVTTSGVLSLDYANVDGTYFANAASKFIMIEVTESGENKGVKVETIDSYKDLYFETAEDAEDTGVTVIVVADDNKIVYGFIAKLNDEEAEDVDATLAVMIDNECVETEDEDENPLYTYQIWVDGKVIDWTIEEEVELENGDVFTYATVDGELVVTPVETEIEVDTIMKGEYFYADGTKYEFADFTFYTIDDEDELKIVAGAKLEVEDLEEGIAASVIIVYQPDEDVEKYIGFVNPVEEEEAE